MAEIKKKSTLDRSARIVDRTADTGMRMKDIALKTKDAMQKNESKEDRSPSAYASGRTTDAAKLAAGKAAQQFYQRGRESVKTTQENICSLAYIESGECSTVLPMFLVTCPLYQFIIKILDFCLDN